MLDPPDRPDVPPRPSLPPTVVERVRSWVSWVGPGRVLAGAVTVLAVLAAAYWLVRPPAPTTESRLPFTSTSPPSSAPPHGGTDGNAATNGQAGSPSATTPTSLVVHVAGAVTSSGVYRLPSGSRVIDAVTVAGGLTTDAQPDAVNLAALLVDGQRVYVPRIGEAVPLPPDGPVSGSTSPAGPVDLNRAGVDELDALPGVGPATAAAIVAYREQHGPFSSVDDLADVRGIGPAKLEALRGLVTV